MTLLERFASNRQVEKGPDLYIGQRPQPLDAGLNPAKPGGLRPSVTVFRLRDGFYRALCRLGYHNWRVGQYPEVMYEDIADWAGTKHCRRCPAFRYWTPREEAEWWRNR